MDKQQFEKLISDFSELKGSIHIETAKKLNLELFERIIKRLYSFSMECEECNKNLIDLTDYIERLKTNKDSLQKEAFKEHNSKVNHIIAHLQKQHKLVSEGQYMSMYMSLGISIGMVFGLAIFDNIALGMPLGMILGMAIGTGMDADAKKKGNTL